MNPDFLPKLQVFTANSMISASAVRNQGASGIAKIARDYAGSLPLAELQDIDGTRFSEWLDSHTNELVDLFPESGRSWGAARKSLNIFLRSAAYTVPLAKRYRLGPLVPLLEVPLDSKVAAGLRDVDNSLPAWASIRRLTSCVSELYQAVAEKDAGIKRVHRADLDVFYWVR